MFHSPLRDSVMLRLKIRPLKANVPDLNPISSLGSCMSLRDFLICLLTCKTDIIMVPKFESFEGDNAH